MPSKKATRPKPKPKAKPRPKPKPKAAPRPKASAAATRSAAPMVGQFMSRSVHTIGRDQKLSLAHALMNEHRIRHLPVLEGGRLVGILSQRDLYFVETIGGDGPEAIAVEEAMTQDVFEVSPVAKLADVVATMLKKKHGSAVVMQRGAVVGVFSTIDALMALLAYVPR